MGYGVEGEGGKVMHMDKRLLSRAYSGENIQSNVSLRIKIRSPTPFGFFVFFFDYLRDKQTDGRTDGRTDPPIELQGCI